MTSFHFCQHLLEARTVKVGAGITVIHKEHRMGKMLFPCILQKDGLLIFNG